MRCLYSGAFFGCPATALRLANGILNVSQHPPKKTTNLQLDPEKVPGTIRLVTQLDLLGDNVHMIGGHVLYRAHLQSRENDISVKSTR